jgi:hypothetical protein
MQAAAAAVAEAVAEAEVEVHHIIKPEGRVYEYTIYPQTVFYRDSTM